MTRRIFLTFTLILLFNTANLAQNCGFLVTSSSSLVCMGDSVCIDATGNVAGAVVGQFDFNTSNVPAGWNISGGTSFGQPCAPSPTGTDYYWSSISPIASPTVTTSPMDVSLGGMVYFDLVFGLQGSASPCDGPDLWQEGVSFQYSIDMGVSWVEIAYFNPLGTFSTTPGGSASGPTAFTTWGNYCFNIPPGAQTPSTQFRWIQNMTSATNLDNWGLDEISIASYQTGTSVIWSTGSTSSSSICIPITSDTTITAFLINSVGDTLSQNQIMVNMANVFNSADTVTICQGDNYTFADGTIASNITTETTHTSSFQNSNGCDSTITTTVIPLASSSNVVDTVMVCENGDYTFADGTIASNITTVTSHTSIFQNSNGCDSTITTTVIPFDVLTSATQTDSTITASNSGAGVSYIWLDCNNNFQVISGETSQTYIPSQSGSYAVIVTENGCSDTSSCYVINALVAVHGLDEFEVNIYPNPTENLFKIDLGSVQSEVNVRIVDGVGSTVFSQKYETVELIEIELMESAGLYFVELSISEKQFVYVLSKQ